MTYPAHTAEDGRRQTVSGHLRGTVALNAGFTAAFAVAGHHGGLPDGGGQGDLWEAPTFCGRMKRAAMGKLVQSVLIFDEAQMLPVPYLRPCVYAIAQLVRCKVLWRLRRALHRHTARAGRRIPGISAGQARCRAVPRGGVPAGDLPARHLPAGGKAVLGGRRGTDPRAKTIPVHRQQPEKRANDIRPAGPEGSGGSGAAGAAERCFGCWASMACRSIPGTLRPWTWREIWRCWRMEARS